MKKILTSFLLLLMLFCQAQNVTPSATNQENQTVIDLYKCYNEKEVDVKPKFPGGETGLASLIMESYRGYALDVNSGKIEVRFCIEKDGRVSAIETPNSKYKGAKDILMEAFHSGPKWSPAEIRNTPVRSAHTATIILTNCK